jgi:hypothetical protein
MSDIIDIIGKARRLTEGPKSTDATCCLCKAPVGVPCHDVPEFVVTRLNAAGDHPFRLGDGQEVFNALVSDASPDLAGFALLVADVLRECWSDDAPTAADQVSNQTVAIMCRRLGLPLPTSPKDRP